MDRRSDVASKNGGIGNAGGDTLASLLQQRATEFPDRPFVSFPHIDVKYAELYQRARGLAKGLIAGGLRPGGHVAVLMPNTPTYIEILFATHLAGGVVVPINARFKRKELSYVLPHSDTEILVTTDAVDDYANFTSLVGLALPTLTEADAESALSIPEAPRLRRIYLDGAKGATFAQPLSVLIEEGRFVSDDELHAATASRRGTDTALLLYTSGTTANPKGCELTHNALIRSWSAYADLVDYRPGESMWTPCPFFHVGGIGVTVASLVRGATMMSMVHFEPDVALAQIERRATEHLFPAFPPLTLGLLRSRMYEPGRLSAVRTVLNVSPAETQTMIQQMLPPQATLLTDFGMTEGAGMITATPTDSAESDRLGRNGEPLPGIEVRIAAPEEPERLLSHGEPGEIQFRGINAFHGYFKDDTATRATIMPGGWVRTGDLGSLNERGSLIFLGRIKDLLKVGGENVTPLEVESHLCTHPAIQMAQVIGRPSERYGEEPIAFVELVEGEESTAQEIIDYCRDHLASYKVPREVRFVTVWPMSATKIQKFRLRQLLNETDG